MSCVNSGRAICSRANSLTLAESGNVVLPRAVTTARQSSTAPKFSRFNVTGVTGIITKTKKNGDGDTENAERCEGVNAQMRVPRGSMKITAIEKRKLSSKREDILDNTEPCQTKKYGAASVVVDEQSWLSSGVEKSPLLNVITITFSRRYLQITTSLQH